MSDSPEPNPKVIITGTGRSGTSFLLHLFAQLGFDCQLKPQTRSNEAHIRPEHIRDEEAWNSLPGVVKSPWSSQTLARALLHEQAAGWLRKAIDHVIVPIRHPTHVVASHNRRNFPILDGPSKVYPDHCTHCSICPCCIQKWRVGDLVTALVVWEIPHTLLTFPKCVQSETYLWEALEMSGLMDDTGVDEFHEAFQATFNPEAFGKERAHYARKVW